MAVRSLAWLVSAVVAGVVRDVTLTGRAELGLSDIADQCGCSVASGEREAECLAHALAGCKGTHALLIASAYRPFETMIDELDSFADGVRPSQAVRLLAAPQTMLQRLIPTAAPTIGLLAPVAQLRANPSEPFSGLVAQLKPVRRFATRAQPIP